MGVLREMDFYHVAEGEDDRNMFEKKDSWLFNM
ncbi:MAG: hypothetical protein Solumvirus3_38, partial [Solumvirus sp.]